VAIVAGSWGHTHFCDQGCDDGSSRPCAHDVLCGCVADQFALVSGAAAQRAYFAEYHLDFVHCRRRHFTNCSVCGGTHFHGMWSPIKQAKIDWRA